MLRSTDMLPSIFLGKEKLIACFRLFTQQRGNQPYLIWKVMLMSCQVGLAGTYWCVKVAGICHLGAGRLGEQLLCWSGLSLVITVTLLLGVLELFGH